LTSRACLSHRRRPSTFSLAASTQDAPPNKWLISHGDRLSELCPCGLFTLMRIASLLTAPGIPRFRGAEPLKRRLEEASTHDANGYQATSSDRCFYKYLVYQVLSGVSVSQGTLCPMTPHILGTSLRTREDASPECGTPGQSKREGGLDLTGSVTEQPYAT
jgi:hypothetical protein